MTKLPIKFFKDFSAPGPLYTILYTAIRHRNEVALRNGETSHAADRNKEEGLNLFLRLEENLIKVIAIRLLNQRIFILYIMYLIGNCRKAT